MAEGAFDPYALSDGVLPSGPSPLSRSTPPPLPAIDGYALVGRLGGGAVESLGTAIELNADDSAAFVGRAESRLALGDRRGARADATRGARSRDAALRARSEKVLAATGP